MQLKGKLHWALHSLPVHILVDSGADENFIDLDLGQQFNLPLVVLPESRQVLALDGRFMAPVTHCTGSLSP